MWTLRAYTLGEWTESPHALFPVNCGFEPLAGIAPLSEGTINLETWAQGDALPPNVTYAGNVFTVTNGANMTFTGATTDRRIVITENATATVTLQGANITGATGQHALTMQSGATLNLSIEGTNTLTGGTNGNGNLVPRTPDAATLNGLITIV